MNAIVAWDRPVVEALGWALVHFLWEGIVIALLLGVALPACRSSKARYAAACFAMLLMLAAFGITIALSMPGQGAAPPLPRAPVAARTLAGDGLAGSAPVAARRFETALPWLVLLWTLGAFLIGFYRLGGWIAVERIRGRGACAAPREWQERLAALANRIGISSPLTLLESSLAEVPLVIGFLRPVILVPAGLLSGLPSSHVEAILLHELAHIRRLDYLANLLQTVAETLLFYHPAVWWISHKIRAERENCCDDMAVAVQGDAHAYATALLALEERRSVRLEAALAATGGNLTHRIRRLLDPPQPPRVLAALILSLGLLLGLFCVLATAQQSSPDKPTAQQEKKAQLQRELQTPYRKWLQEDVAYIITDEERSAYRRLQTDQERERFIGQFWVRRDPTPATPENEFKEEHYRRIAYANEHFGSALPGWKTDRGRIYIVYGPPDEIEDHSPESQSWRYRHIEGVGENVIVEFVDPEHKGEFHMTMDPKQDGQRANGGPQNAAEALRQFAALQNPPNQINRRMHRVLSTTQITHPELYQKWLSEDVAYLITYQERVAFEHLQSDQEIENFIEQFWLQRDPTPGTIENEFKEEHYRRVAYANEHYSWPGGHPGWTSDRGHVYIVYGPPDEIENHSSGGSYDRPPQQGGGQVVTYPFQQWLYRHIEGVGDNVIIEFVDPQRTGEFHMTKDPHEKEQASAPEQKPQHPAELQAAAGSTRAPNLYLEVMVGRPVDVKTITNILASMNLPALFNPGPLNGDLMRVPVGPFSDMETTDRVRSKLQQAGFHSIGVLTKHQTERR